MDQRAEFEHSVEGMEWGDMLSTLQAVIGEMLRDAPNCPPSSLPPPSPPLPTGPGVDTHLQSVEGLGRGYGGCISGGAALHSFEQPGPSMATTGVNIKQVDPISYQGLPCYQKVTQSHHLFHQAGAYSQGQYLSYQWPAHDVATAAAASYPAAISHPYNDVPVVRLPEGRDQILTPVGVLNRSAVSGVSADGISAACPPNFSMSNFSYRRKRQLRSQQDNNRPYVKKPLNAFMMFMKEQRPIIVAEMNMSKSAVINVILGQRWNSLSEKEQAKYYEEADKERLLHSQRHPDWSSSENYGKRRKRIRTTAPINVQAAAFIHKEVTQQAKMPPTAQTVPIWPQYTQTSVTLPMCDICHQPQVYKEYWLDSPTVASTKLVFLAASTEVQTARVQPLKVEQLEPLCLTSQTQLPSLSPSRNMY